MIKQQKDKPRQAQIVDMEGLVPQNHLVRKVDRAVAFDEIYPMVEKYYCQDKGRPAVDPVVLVKIVLLQHLFGLSSLRKTIREVEVNVTCRWFLGFDFQREVPHFATVSYAFVTRFPSDLFEEIFNWILESAVGKGFVDARTIFIDGTHVKASANKNKKRKEQALITARIYDKQLGEEIDADRIARGKKPLKSNKDKENPKGGGKSKEVTVATVAPDSGLFHKGNHKVEFAYTAHVGCGQNNFILSNEITAGNVHDSRVFHQVYEDSKGPFEEVETAAVDGAYKTPWICKKVQSEGRNISTPYKRPMTQKGFFKKYE